MSRLSLAVVMLMSMVLLGCRHHHRKQKPLPTSAPAPVTEVYEQKLTPPPVPRPPVMQGPSPLAYMVDSGGLVQVIDAQSQAMLAQGVASPRAIVSIDDTSGVRIGDQLYVKGPLVPGRTYQIFVDNSGGADNVWKTELIKPGTR
jgi:hypothetical protein